MIQEIGGIRQSTPPDLRQSNKLDTSINRLFTDNLVAPPIFSELLCDKLSNSTIGDLYTRYSMSLAADPVNTSAPQFVDLGLLTINALSKSSSIWTPSIIVVSPAYIAHGSSMNNIFEIVTSVRDKLSAKSDYSYNTNFETWR